MLIQKPMGETLDEAHAIVDLCHRKGLIAAVNFQLRWAPEMLAARRITDAGLLGQLHDIEIQVSVHMPWELWSFLSAAPRLEILYHSIHYIDLVRSWLGNPAGVYAKTVRSPQHLRSRPPRQFSPWIMANGCASISPPTIATTSASRCSEAMCSGKARRRHARSNGRKPRLSEGKPDSLATFEGDEAGEGWRTLPTHGNWFPDAFIGSMNSLQQYVTGESDVLPTRVEDALDTMRVVEAAYLSSEQGGVALPD